MILHNLKLEMVKGIISSIIIELVRTICKRRLNKMFIYKKKQDEDLYVKKGQLISPCIKKSFFYYISVRLLGYLIDRIDKKRVSL